MAMFSEDEYALLLKKQGKVTKPRSKGELQKLKDRGADIPKRRRGERSKNRTGAQGLPPIDSGKGKYTKCLDCGNTWRSITNKRVYTERQGDVVYDKFQCKCGHRYDKYK